MNSPFDTFRQEANNLSLTQEEKEQTRAILTFAQEANRIQLDPADKLAFRMQLVHHMHKPEQS